MRSNTLATCRELIPVSASVARHSRVNWSIMVSTRSARPSPIRSWTKSSAHCRLGRVSCASDTPRWVSSRPGAAPPTAADNRSADGAARVLPAHRASPVRRPPCAPGNARWSGRSRPAGTRAARLSRTGSSLALPQCAGLPAQAVFCDHRLEHFLVQTQLSYHLLQPPVLLLQLRHPPRLGQLHSRVPLPPPVKCCLRDPVMPNHLACALARLHFLQDPDDLFFAVPIAPHLSLLPLDSLYHWSSFRGAGHAASPATKRARRVKCCAERDTL